MKRILIIDDHKLIFDGIKNRMPELFLFDYASNPQDALDLCSVNSYKVAIIDISLGKHNGFDLAKLLKYKIKSIFFLSMHNNPFYAQEAKRSGYQGYFLKEESLDILMEGIINPNKKEFWCGEEVLALLDVEEREKESLYEQLTSREQQIFRLLAEGLGYKEIAYQLSISSKTVSTHREKIFKKMNLDSLASLVKEAIKLRIISLD